MKKSKVKAILIALIIVICLNIGVYAAYVLSATDVNYTKSDGITVSVKAALDELYTIKALAKAVSVGDYVAYDATNNYSYTSPTGTGTSHGNGYGSQTFTSDSSIKWRVFGWDELTGGVILISEAPIGSFALKGAIGYLYAEQELNNICAIYGHGTGANTSKIFNYVVGNAKVGTITGSGARSINVGDINAITGYILPEGDAYGPKDIYYPTIQQSTGYSASTANIIDLYTLWDYEGSSYLTSTEEPYKMLFRDTTNSSNIKYYLSSRFTDADYSYTDYFVGIVGGGSVIRCTDSDEWIDGFLGEGNETGWISVSTNYGVRPLVYLKSSIQTNGKNSSGEWNIIDK